MHAKISVYMKEVKMKRKAVPRRKSILIILDGFGVNPSKKYNAVYEANTPRLDEYFGQYPHTTLLASGSAVGLPEGQMGNSEVGHFTIGCGSILKQDLVRIDDSIEEGNFFEREALLDAVSEAKANQRPLHLVGLVSDGGVHSHIDHLLALLTLCKQHGVEPVVHAITDGRDTAPTSAKRYIEIVLEKIKETGGHIATLSGRYYAMDRDRRWERTQTAWDAIINGIGEQQTHPLAAIDAAYVNGETDEFIKPVVFENAKLVQEDDQMIFFNFRNDRPRQLAAAIGQEDFDGFDRGDYEPIQLTCLTEYDKKLLAPIVFRPQRPSTNLSHVVSLAGHKQFHCAETEKYAHVTFFFNGGRETPYAGEVREMINSPDVSTYDLKPEMSATDVADSVVAAIEKDDYAFIVVNFANGDMVGHTAVPESIVQAVEAMDGEVGRVLDAAVKHDYSVLLTADHGNCDEYRDPLTGQPHTQHTTYPVPCMIIDQSHWRLSSCGGLSNIAPTILHLMGISKPKGMAGKSLLLDEIDIAEQKKALANYSE